ncbi:hypothetical protein LLG96_17420 [bacterium]|nr:hypothetical protein [bacterium]
MNRYIYIGTFVIALGTLLMAQIFENEKLIVIGGIINAVGLFLMTKGSLISSKKDKSEIVEKIKGFREEMTEMKGTITNKESLNKIDKIEHEFNEWAEAFIGNIESKKVEHEKSEIILKEKEINLSKKWMHIYQYTFELIPQMLKAYNQKAKNKIEFIIPELPKNLFDKEVESFKSSIIFSESTAWTITLKIKKPYKEDKIPSIMINFHFVNSPGENVRIVAERDFPKEFLFLSFDLKNKYFDIYENDSNINFGDIKSRYSISNDNYKNSIKDLFTALIEFQIVNLKS